MGTGAKTGDHGSGQLHGSREPAVPPARTERATAAAMTGSLAIFAAIRRASSFVSNLAAERRRDLLLDPLNCKKTKLVGVFFANAPGRFVLRRIIGSDGICERVEHDAGCR